jgi:hypothetical protein
VRRPTRSAALIGIAMTFSALVLPGGTPGAGAASTAETAVHFFEPYTATGLSSSVKVTRTSSGYCWIGSNVAEDPNAYRCFIGNEIVDPCFASPFVNSPTAVVCGDPWDGVIQLRLTKSLPSRSLRDSNVDPQVGWLLQLANGSRCQISGGATGSVDGVRVAYACSGSAQAGALIWTGEPWRVEFIAKGATKPTSEVVSVAWGA